ncbi:hypothetical protein BDQ12DRAFT_737664 [Crucibulum laeve]|uniref:Rhodopsin domain-containing protein n=1 Tax=Crucibulum laeve TaxID=68775 RepID=A0A5C3LQW9_9AGAR|nr:hypothetical protein BDQ12DRAFT_737664 [Crucibulum laeve]
MIPVQPYLPWKVSVSILHLIAALSTVLRVEYRRRTRRLWWDDYASIVSAIFGCFSVAIIWFRLGHFDDSEHSHILKVSFAYMSQTCYGFTIWWSRISLALAVVRITPTWSKTRPWVIGFTCAFILIFVALVLGMTITCATNTAWQHVKGDIFICGPSYGVTLISVIIDIMCDLLLVGFPLYRLWYIKLQLAQHRLVLLVFSTSLLNLIAVMALAVVSYGKVFKGPGALLVWVMTVIIEEAVSVIACNLPVLFLWGYRTFSSDDDEPLGDHVTPHWSRVALGGVSTPAFSLSDLPGGHSQTSDDVVQISASEASLPSQIGTHREENFNNGWMATENVSDSISRKDTIV